MATSHKVLRHSILLRVYPAMLESAVGQLGAVQKLALHKLQVAEPRAVSESGEHAGWDEAISIFNKTLILRHFCTPKIFR